MRNFLKFMFCCLPLAPVWANALVITDVISINREADSAVLDFDLRRGGYNPLTDSITLVTLTYDVREIVEFDDYDDDSTLESGEQYSMIFDRKSYFRDISTGTFTQQIDWYKSDTCQIGGFDGEPCEYSLDLFGTTAEYFRFYSGNIWFGEGTLTVEVNRISVPEPSAIILFCLGITGVTARRVRYRFN